jgi:hypothetical protein
MEFSLPGGCEEPAAPATSKYTREVTGGGAQGRQGEGVGGNDYIFARVQVASDELKTLPVGVQDLLSAAVVDWGLIMAAGILITIPALAFFMAVQRPRVAGWGSAGLKG